MTAARRMTSGRATQIADSLTAQDLEIIEALSSLRLACTRQLERLVFTEGTPLSRARSCRRRLERLTELAVVEPLGRRVGGVRAGSAGYVWSLGVAGQHLANVVGPAGGARRRPWTPGPAFFTHRLAITELFVRLTEASRSGQLDLVDFASEPAAWSSYVDAFGNRVQVKPDALVVAATEDDEFVSFVEIDRSTQSLGVIERKCQVYEAAWRSGSLLIRDIFPAVVFIANSERRADTLQQHFDKRQNAGLPFSATTDDQATSHLIGGER